MDGFKSWNQMTELEQSQCMFWDMYKDAYGHRPRGIDTSNWTLQDFSAEFAQLSKVIDENEKLRIASENLAIIAFEERVQELIDGGAGSRETALRWIHDAEGSDGDDEYLCFLIGLPYGYFRQAA